MAASQIPSVYKGWYSYVVLFMSLGVLSCGPALMLVYGIHQPKYRSDSAVAKYALRLNLDEDIYRLKEYSDANRKQYKYIGLQVPEVMLFNANGRLAIFKADSSCSLNPLVQLSLQEIDMLAVTENSLPDFLAHAYTISGNLNFAHEENTPVYVVKFAEYAGLLNKDRVPDMLEILRQRDDVQYLILNMDYSVR
jgi:hypothetical protein